MQKWLYNSILMYSTYIEGNSVDAEKFIRTLKGNIYKKMTANNIKSYPGYLNKLVAEYNNSYNCSIGRKPIDVDCPALTEEIERNF